MYVQDEQTLEALELTLPEGSGEVFAKAQLEALSAGLEVLVSKSGGLFRLTPDGNAKFVKKVPRPVKVRVGKRYLLP